MRVAIWVQVWDIDFRQSSVNRADERHLYIGNQPLVGTTFNFTLPLASEDIEQAGLTEFFTTVR